MNNNNKKNINTNVNINNHFNNKNKNKKQTPSSSTNIDHHVWDQVTSKFVATIKRLEDKIEIDRKNFDSSSISATGLGPTKEFVSFNFDIGTI